MRRFWIDDVIEDGQKLVSLSGEVWHHIYDVCRMRKGDRFEILTPDGLAFFVQLNEAGKRDGRAEILENREIPQISGPRVTLCLSVPRFSTMDSVVEKSVELGVHRIQPFFSDYSFVKNSSKISDSRFTRWNKIVKSATQQSGRADLMSVDAPIALREVLKKFNQNSNLKGLFCYEGEASKTLGSVLRDYRNPGPDAEIWVFVGSEGGFSNEEVKLFQEHSLEPLTLGEQILRVETACVALISIIKYEVNAFG